MKIVNEPPSVKSSQECVRPLRSAFVHGHAGLQKISTPQRVLARNLARQVACALVALAGKSPQPRAEVLADLLEGVGYLKGTLLSRRMGGQLANPDATGRVHRLSGSLAFPTELATLA